MSVQFGHGHGIIGGKNQPGNYGNGRNEVDVVREILLGVRKVLRQPAYAKLDWYQLNLDSKNHEFNVIRYQNIRNDLVYTFHTNAFNGKAQGTETYWCTNNAKTKNAASKMNKAVVGALGTLNRGVKNGMGYLVSSYARQQNADLVLVELFFQDNASDYKKWQANKKKLVNAIAKVIVEDAGGKWSGAGEATKPVEPSKPKLNAEIQKWTKTLPDNAIGIYLYRTENDNERRLNAYKSDKMTKIEGDGYFNTQIEIGTNGARGVYDQKGKKQTYEKKKGTKIIGKFIKR